MTEDLDRLTVLVAELTGLLGQTAKAFRFFPHGFVQVQAGVDRLATDSGLHTLAFRLLPALFRALTVGLRVLSELLGLPTVFLRTRLWFGHAPTSPLAKGQRRTSCGT
jgi:hypothetical protein